MEALIAQYGYLLLLAGTFFEGETVLVLGGVAAHQGHLELSWVILAAFVGSYSGDQTWFYLARRFGAGWIARRPALAERVAKAMTRMGRHTDVFVLTFRFFYGVRSVAPIALAASGYPLGRFMVLNCIAAAVWAVVVGLAGYLFSDVVERVLGDAKSIQIKILIGLGVAAFVFFVGRWLWRRYRPSGG